MKKALTLSKRRRRVLCALASLTLCLQAPLATAKTPIDGKMSEDAVDRQRALPESQIQNARVAHDTYILGPGDRLHIELLDLPELSGVFTIGPDGIIYLPRLRALQIEGLTIEELRLFLTDQFRPYVRQPELFITPVGYRPVRVYVGGEVARPGYYTIRGAELVQDLTFGSQQQRFELSNSGAVRARPSSLSSLERSTSASGRSAQQSEQLPAPTLFDALQAANGVTPFSQLDTVRVTRKRHVSQGGGKIQTKVNFLRFISNGDESVNIRLYDGDAIFVRKSDDLMRDQLLAAVAQTFPRFHRGVRKWEGQRTRASTAPPGSFFNQAIASAGGPKLLRGSVEFCDSLRRRTDRRIFNYNPKAISGDYRNPVLIPGDVVRVNESLISASLEVLNEITTPAVGLYSVYSIFR